jgi:hypothetical protein
MGSPEAEAVKSISMLLLLLTSAALGSAARNYLGSLMLSATVFIIGQLILDFAGVVKQSVLDALFDTSRLGFLFGQLVAVWIVMALMRVILAGVRWMLRRPDKAEA